MKMQCYYVAQVYNSQSQVNPKDWNTACRYVAGPFAFYNEAAEVRQEKEYNQFNRDQYYYEVVIADIEVIL